MIFDVIFTIFKLLHPLNVLSLIEVTPDGIVIDINDSQKENASVPIEVTEDGMFIDVRFWQLRKPPLPIDMIFDVIFTFFKLVKSKNAL